MALAVPGKEIKEIRDIELAEKILEEDHYGWKRSRNASSNTWRCANS